QALPGPPTLLVGRIAARRLSPLGHRPPSVWVSPSSQTVRGCPDHRPPVSGRRLRLEEIWNFFYPRLLSGPSSSAAPRHGRRPRPPTGTKGHRPLRISLRDPP